MSGTHCPHGRKWYRCCDPEANMHDLQETSEKRVRNFLDNQPAEPSAVEREAEWLKAWESGYLRGLKDGRADAVKGMVDRGQTHVMRCECHTPEECAEHGWCGGHGNAYTDPRCIAAERADAVRGMDDLLKQHHGAIYSCPICLAAGKEAADGKHG